MPRSQLVIDLLEYDMGKPHWLSGANALPKEKRDEIRAKYKKAAEEKNKEEKDQ